MDGRPQRGFPATLAVADDVDRALGPGDGIHRAGDEVEAVSLGGVLGSGGAAQPVE
jgi:hypothetical protein